MILTHTRDLQTAPKNGVNYDIVLSESIIKAEANGTIHSDGIIVKAYRTDGSVRSGNILPDSEYPEEGDYYYAEYSKDGGAWTRCGQFYYPTGPSDDIEWVDRYGIGYSVVESAATGIAFRLKHTSNDSVVLKELPPIKIVRDGTDSVDVVCGVQQVNIRCGSDGKASSNQTKSTTFQLMNKNGTRATCSSVSVLSKPSGVTTRTHSDVAAIPAYGFFCSVGKSVSKSAFEGDITLEVVGTVAGITYTKRHIIPVVAQVDGEKGNTGKTGPMWYLAGSWQISKAYERTDDLVPVVEHNGYYWYLKKENYIADGEEPTASSDTWELAENLQMVFTEALFANFAKLGSSIISGDWMFSQYGTINGNASTDYSKFKAADPEGLTVGNFRPVYAVNLLTGKIYLGDAVLTGILKTKAIYTINGSIKTVSGRQTIDLTDNAGNAYVLPGNTTVYVPAPTSYEGLELTILFSAGSVFACDIQFYLAYYSGTGSSVIANGMGVKAFHSSEGLSVLTIKAIRAYGTNNDVRWVVVGQRGILGIRNTVDGTDNYQLCPDGRLVI